MENYTTGADGATKKADNSRVSGPSSARKPKGSSQPKQPRKPRRPKRPDAPAENAPAADMREPIGRFGFDAREVKLPSGFRYNLDTYQIEIVRQVDDDEAGAREWTPFCSPLQFVHRVRDGESKAWHVLVRLWTKDGIANDFLMPRKLLAGRGDTLQAELLDRGLEMWGTATELKRLFNWMPATAAQLADRTGWHGSPGASFVLPHATLQAPGSEAICLKQGTTLRHRFAQAGTFEGWQNFTADMYRSPRLALGLLVTLSGPLWRLLAEEPAIFHVHGSSTTGKSTSAAIAASVWGSGGEPASGGFMRSWRITDNAIESVARAHSDVGLVLDEIHMVEPGALFKIAYLLIAGEGKGRADQTGEARESKRWSVAVLSNGEKTFADVLRDADKRATGGQSVRFIDVAADDGAGFGIFRKVPDGFDGAKAYSEHLRACAGRDYGFAGPEFVRRLQQAAHEDHNFIQSLRERLRLFERNLDSSPNHPEIARVLRKFAVLALAGELAIDFGILRWPETEAYHVVQPCFAGWRTERGTRGSHDEVAALNALRDWLVSSAGTFLRVRIDNTPGANPQPAYHGDRITERQFSGWQVTTISEKADESSEYLILPNALNKGLKGHSVDALLRLLRDRGLLRHDKGRLTRRETLPHPVEKRERIYAIAGRIHDTEIFSTGPLFGPLPTTDRGFTPRRTPEQRRKYLADREREREARETFDRCRDAA